MTPDIVLFVLITNLVSVVFAAFTYNKARNVELSAQLSNKNSVVSLMSLSDTNSQISTLTEVSSPKSGEKDIVKQEVSQKLQEIIREKKRIPQDIIKRNLWSKIGKYLFLIDEFDKIIKSQTQELETIVQKQKEQNKLEPSLESKIEEITKEIDSFKNSKQNLEEVVDGLLKIQSGDVNMADINEERKFFKNVFPNLK